MNVFDQPLAVLDVETTGMNAAAGRIIEVAAIRLENQRVITKLSTLVNPETYLDPYIKNITGIDSNQLERAPLFSDIADELASLLDGAVLIAHNVRFDYSFLRSEFKRLGRRYEPKMMCSVRLSRQLYPQYRRHSLDSLIERFGLSVRNRHRAYDDAWAVWQFIKLIQIENSVEAIETAVARQIKRPSLPPAVDEGLLAGLPDGPGVYIFEDEKGQPLYIGKSVNIRKRVLSHFSSDHSSVKELKIAQNIKHIDTVATNGELEALLLESKMIKSRQPLYNRKLRRLSKLFVARSVTGSDGYMRVNIAEADSDSLDPGQLEHVLGVFRSRSKARQALESYVKLYGICPKLIGLENGPGSCFMYQLKKCPGACLGKEATAKHNFKIMTAFHTTKLKSWPYPGPVLLAEAPSGSGASGVIIDQWCVLGVVKENKESDIYADMVEKQFDLDTYKILQGFVGAKKKSLKITPLDDRQLRILTS